MDLISLFLITHENNEIKPPTKIYDFTVLLLSCLFICLLSASTFKPGEIITSYLAFTNRVFQKETKVENLVTFMQKNFFLTLAYMHELILKYPSQDQ